MMKRCSKECADQHQRPWKFVPVSFSLRSMLFGVLLLSAPLAWVSHQRSRWAQEQSAVVYLHSRNDAATIFIRNADGIIEFVDSGPRWELLELWNGRLFNPIASVSLYDATVDEELVRYLEMLPYLKRLILRDCRFDIKTILNLSRFQYLKDLDHTGCRFPLEKMLPQLHKLDSLENLGLGNTGISDKHLTYIEQLKSLRELKLYGNDITYRGLLHVGKLTSLERLNLGSTQCSSRGI